MQSLCMTVTVQSSGDALCHQPWSHQRTRLDGVLFAPFISPSYLLHLLDPCGLQVTNYYTILHSQQHGYCARCLQSSCLLHLLDPGDQCLIGWVSPQSQAVSNALLHHSMLLHTTHTHTSLRLSQAFWMPQSNAQTYSPWHSGCRITHGQQQEDKARQLTQLSSLLLSAQDGEQ